MAYTPGYNSVVETPYPLLNPPVVSHLSAPSASRLYENRHHMGSDPKYARTYTHEKSKGWLVRVAVFATIAFVVLSQSMVYRLINSVYGMMTGDYFYILSDAGCPTAVGTVMHAIMFFVFMLVILF